MGADRSKCLAGSRDAKVIALLRAVFGALVAISVFMASALGAWVWYPVDRHIAVNHIEVVRAVEGQPVLLSVDRTLGVPGVGRYDVTIREYGSNSRYCATGPVEGPYEPFDAAGNPTLLADPLDLGWWAWGGNCSTKAQTLPVGHYVMTTCHSFRPFDFMPWKRHCWEPVVFSVVASD